MGGFFRRVRDEFDEKSNQMQPAGEFFQNKRKWEVKELRRELNSSSTHKQKAGIKRIIANMTLGRDVSAFFVDVVKIGQTDNLELKRLVHLYILHNAKLRPEEALLAVNSLLMDLKSPSPLVRALALRTTMCVCVHGVLEHSTGALLHAITTESDPYVLKTAVLGVGKLLHYSEKRFLSAFCTDVEGRSSTSTAIEPKLLLSCLQPLNGALVCSNAAVVVKEMLDYLGASVSTSFLGSDVFQLHLKLGEANEWGKIYILELLAVLELTDTGSIEKLLTSVLPYVLHSNPAVVLSAIKVLAKFAGKCPTTNLISATKISSEVNSALKALCTREPETQYVVFKNIHLLIVIFPLILQNDLQIFYVRFDDPSFLKIEKVRLLLKLVTPSTAEAVFQEFSTYSHEVNATFVEEVVKAVGFLGVKVNSLAEQCEELIFSVLKRHPELNTAVLKAAHALVRQYPHFLERILNCKVFTATSSAIKLEDLEDPDGKETLLVLFSEYPHSASHEKILGVVEELAKHLLQEVPQVQLQLLRTVITIWTRDPHREQVYPASEKRCSAEEDYPPAAPIVVLLRNILEELRTKSEDADVRDTAIGYWRLLSRGMTPQRMEAFLLALSPSTAILYGDSSFSDEMTLKDLKRSINTTAAILGRPYRSFLPPYGECQKKGNDSTDSEEEDDEDEEKENEVDSPAEMKASRGTSRRSPSTSSTSIPCGRPPPSFSVSKENMESRKMLSCSTPGTKNSIVDSRQGSVSSSPSSQEEFVEAWERIGGGSSPAQLEIQKDLSCADVDSISKWMRSQGYVVAAVISSLNKIIFMASAPSLNSSALFQWVVHRNSSAVFPKVESASSVIIVKGEKCEELVHVLALRLRNASTET